MGLLLEGVWGKFYFRYLGRVVFVVGEGWTEGREGGDGDLGRSWVWRCGFDGGEFVKSE